MDLPKHITNPDPSIYLSDNYVVFDTESTTLDRGSAVNKSNKLVLTVWGNGGNYKSIYGDEFSIAEVVEACEQADFVVAQNAKHDLQWLVRAGADLTKIVVYDTMLGAYVEDGNVRKRRDLNSLAARYKVRARKDKLVNAMIKMGVCPSEIPRSWLELYCEADVRTTEQVFLKQRELLHENNLLPVLYTRCLFTVPLADIEFNGMHLDSELVEKEYIRLCYELADAERQLKTLTGGINPRSTKQLGEFLYGTLKFPVPKDRYGHEKKTTTGNYPTDKRTIAGLKPRTKKQKLFLELKSKQSKLNAALSKNIEFFQGVCEELGGTFTAQFNQAVTVTHRLSSSGRKTKFAKYKDEKSVQFQNMPRGYKPMFCSRNDGWLIGEIDQAQLEFRVAGHSGKDKQVLYDINNKVDIHQFTANTLTEAGQPTDRQGAKEHTFKPLYGGSSGTEAEQAYYEAFKKKYADLTTTQEGWVNTVLMDKKLVLETGLICYWPDTEVTRSGYITNTSQIYNLPIQNLATAEIVPVGVTYQWHRMKAAKMKSFLVNTIHDSSIGEVHPEEKDQYAEIGEQAFVHDVIKYLDVVYGINFEVPLEAEMSFGRWWGEKQCKECGALYNPLNGHSCETGEANG